MTLQLILHNDLVLLGLRKVTRPESKSCLDHTTLQTYCRRLLYFSACQIIAAHLQKTKLFAIVT